MLSLYLIVGLPQAKDDQRQPYPLEFRKPREALGFLFPIFLHHLVDSSREKVTIG